MNSTLRFAKLSLLDFLSNHSALRQFVGIAEVCYACLQRKRLVGRQVGLRGISRLQSPCLLRFFGRRAATHGDDVRPSLPRHEAILAQSRLINRSLVLKPALADGEKGVVLVQFEYNWFRLLAQVPLWEEIEKRYDVIWGTSW